MTVQTTEVASRVVDEQFARSVLPRRAMGTHKWDVGGVLIVGGAPGYLGAPALAAMGAMRAGAGIVNLAVARSTIGVTTTIVPEAVFFPLPDSSGLGGMAENLEAILQTHERCRATVVGCGIGTDKYANELLDYLFGFEVKSSSRKVGFGSELQHIDSDSLSPLPAGKPVVLDADGLNWLATKERWWEQLPEHSLTLTPHAGELARLMDISVEDVSANPHDVAKAAATQWKQTVVLKCQTAIVTDGKQQMIADDTPVSLATAGSGDVLAGVIGAFLAQGMAPIDAAGLAFYAGTRAARKLELLFGSLGVIAGELPAAYAQVLASLEQEN